MYNLGTTVLVLPPPKNLQNASTKRDKKAQARQVNSKLASDTLSFLKYFIDFTAFCTYLLRY